jgi:hypothetical protein
MLPVASVSRITGGLLGTAAVVLLAAGTSLPAAAAPAASSQDQSGGVCIGHHPNPYALFGQAFLELRFYPDSVVNTCSSDGGYNVTYAPDKFKVCSTAWQVSTQSGAEDAAFDAELYDGTSKSPLVMSAGDIVRIHFHLGTAGQGRNVTVTDVTTGHSGTIVLNSKHGPLLPLYATQQIGNALGWGLVDDTPNAFVWEIGHMSDFSTPAGQLCYRGRPTAILTTRRAGSGSRR